MTDIPPSKAVAQLQQLRKAAAFLTRMLAEDKSEMQRAAVIQSFEFCFELAWKYLKSLVEEEGGMVASPKAAFREAAQREIIDNPEEWFDFLGARNLTTHTYVEAIAEAVYDTVKDRFAAALETLINEGAGTN